MKQDGKDLQASRDVTVLIDEKFIRGIEGGEVRFRDP